MMHRAIGEKLEAAIPEPTEKILFALAHHFNSAMDDGRAEDVELAARALKHNTLAGKAAYTSGSWHTAERYFENAADIMKQWGTKVASLEDEARVAETLADLSAAQKNHGKALRVYRQLLSKRLPVDMHAAIAYKAIYFQLVGGIMSDTSRLINQTLTFMRRAIPKVTPVQKFLAVWHILLDVLPGDRRKKRLQQLLGLAHALRKHNSEELDRKTPAIKLYLAGSALHLRDNWWLALIYHTYALKMGLKGRGSPTNLIKMVADRGAILGYLGFHKTAYHLFDLSMDVARACRLKEVYGYVALSRMLTLDYIKGRTEEVGDHLKEAMHYIGPNQDRLSYGLGICFKIYRELVRCNFTVVYKLCQFMPDVIPTRNWMSPRSIAMMLFGYLLQGSRDNIVLHGEMFLKRRAKVAGRSNDIFITVIKALISFARGEIDKTRESFIQTMQEFVESKQKEFLYPFEEDFIGIFAFTFPVLFEQEYGRHLMRVNEMQTLLVALRKRVKKIKGQDREVPLLLLARANEMLGHSRPIRGQYDAALRHARVTNNNIVQIFAYAWFGIHLTEAGQQKKDYIRRAFILAQKHDLKAIMTYTRKIMEQRGIYLKEAQLINTSHTSTQTGAVQHGNTPSPLFVENLNHVCDAVESEVGLDEDLEESFKILAKHYAAARTMCFFTAGAEGQVKVIFPSGTQANESEIIDYISPYFNIRSTLYLPMNDAPWHRSEGEADKAQSLSFTDDEETAQEQPFDGESTMVVEQSSTMDMDATIVESTGVVNDQSDRSSTVRNAGDAPVRIQGNLAMSALVPLRSDFDSLGVIFLENVSNLHGRDSTVTRHELDQFGAQIGILVERKIRDNVRTPETSYLEESCKATYQPASFTLEKPDWLKVWSHGRLRAQRETTWYLGLSLGKDHYMVAYCSLTGDEYVRDRLSSMLWHHMYVVRAQCVAAGRSRIELSDLREELSGLFAAVPRASTLDSIAVSFTIFNKNDQVAVSGHYGPSRPFVVGTENVVTPYNEVILQFSSGRDLRYWEVAASLADPHAYILSYDTSKIDQAPVDTLQKQVAESIAFASGEEEMHQALCSLVAEEHLPRYYVAAVMRDESQEEVKPEPENSEDEDEVTDQKLDKGA
jgi:tetratricopeptide (TPR) repeat protein